MSNNPSNDSTEISTTCSRFGCDADAVAKKREDAILIRCEDGHVESSTFDLSDSSGPQSSDVEHDDEEVPDGLTQGTVDGTLDRTDGYGRGRPSKDEVGSKHRNQMKRVPTIDTSRYVDEDEDEDADDEDADEADEDDGIPVVDPSSYVPDVEAE